eukprot:gene32017-40450_t
MLRKNVAFSRCTVVANEEEDLVPSHITEGAEFVLTEELVRLEVCNTLQYICNVLHI